MSSSSPTQVRFEAGKIVQCGPQEHRVVPVRRGDHDPQRDAVAVGEHGPFGALFAAVARGFPGGFATTRGFDDAPIDRHVLKELLHPLHLTGPFAGDRRPGAGQVPQLTDRLWRQGVSDGLCKRLVLMEGS